MHELLLNIMRERQANNIRIMDYIAALPNVNETGCEHADHTVSARLVLQAMRYGRYNANVKGCVHSSPQVSACYKLIYVAAQAT
jgi:hypothetical protein